MSTQNGKPEENNEISASNAQAKAFDQLIYPLVSEIDDSDRLRPIDMGWAEALAASILKDGLLNPVEVCRMPGRSGYKLGPGGHRLAAAKLLGWETIPAFLRSANALDRKAREIVENIFQAGLEPLDRAVFVAELYSIEKVRAGIGAEADGRVHSANMRWQKALKTEANDATAMIAGAYGMQANIAKRIGLSERSLRDDLLLFKRLSPEVAARARGSKIAGNAAALRQLAALEPLEQKRVIELLMNDAPCKTVAQALAIVRKKPVVQPETKRLSTFIGTFARMGRKEKLQALRMLAEQLPGGVVLDFGDAPIAEAAE